MNYKISVQQSGRTIEKECSDKLNLLDFINNHTDFNLPAPCGGKGRCGKCRIKILSGNVSDPGEEEKKHLDEDINQGYRLACLSYPGSDLEVLIEKGPEEVQILHDLLERQIPLDPPVKTLHVLMDKPHADDQRSDFSRLIQTAGMEKAAFPLALLQDLADTIREQDYSVTVVHDETAVIRVLPGDVSGECYGIAVDIGTTTVVVYLIDLNTGETVDVVSDLNAQGSFGADVISRINHTMTNEQGLRMLHKKIIEQLNRMITSLSDRTGIAINKIYTGVFAGNTTMIHLFLGIKPENIAAAPFISVSTEGHTVPSEDTGLVLNGTATVLPGLSGYVGADIVAAVLSSGMMENEELCLLIDIGTNGEIVLGNSEKIVACSTAAGPAFEGAHIRHGVGGVGGAINTAADSSDGLSVTTILGKQPIGICGSGLVDILAVLIKAGVVEETGRMIGKDESDSISPAFARLLTEEDGESAFIVVPEDKAAGEEAILFTQKDVREVQLAKAAIAAGIQTLLKFSDKKAEDIGTLYLAGGFGSFIDKRSAVAIGLLPHQLENKIKVIGNAAGKGAVMACISRKQAAFCSQIKARATYVELSSSPEFQEAYVENMYFNPES
ncbi:MAG: ASKHA domain-containing protein [Spirochaetia bacterium]